MEDKFFPHHVAIIMDGNGRWAKKRFLPKKAGHSAGGQTVRKLAEKMNEEGFKILTLFAFSTENWSRPKDEVDELMALLRDYIQQYIDDSKKNNIRINILGDLEALDADLRKKSLYLMELTKNHDGLCLNIALNYGGRDELTRAMRKIAEKAADGRINPNGITELDIKTHLDTAEFPDPDLLIRTSGEKRISNFMLWQLAYTELYFCDKLWPDFTFLDLMTAIRDYWSRDRRYGSRK